MGPPAGGYQRQGFSGRDGVDAPDGISVPELVVLEPTLGGVHELGARPSKRLDGGALR